MPLPSDPPLTCGFCAGRPVYRDRQNGLFQCADHLERSIRERVEKVLSTRVRKDDRVGIALSGGKDSTVLLYLLHSLLSSRRDVELIALTVDEGIRGYREHSLLAAQEHARHLGIPHQVLGFAEIAGTTLDNLVKEREDRSCTICGILRRKALLQLAREWGVSVIATGHCLNDEAQTVLMNTLRGDLPRLLRTPQRDERFIPRIKPLGRVSEKEITVHAMTRGIYSDLPECPYAHHALRSEVRKMLDRFEYTTPGTMGRIVTFPEQLVFQAGERVKERPPVP
ncbi:MAG: tRNA 2-thiocytidine biosynthesis TtcA family protein, partial [Methanomicrobiales archaeon]|nr:tRNA 2-thiocytidine biosynthesis TtcA family protein [Methanomicrobiales archaeon]